MNLPDGKRILWADFRYPPRKHPPCTDDRIIDFIEAKRGFGEGRKFWVDKEPAEILINPEAVPDDCEAQHLEKAAKQLVKMGVHVNPKLLLDPDAEEEERPEEPPQLPSKGAINSMKRKELDAVVERFSWEFDEGLNVNDLKVAIKEKIDVLSA